METLSWEILARDRMSEVLDKLAASTEKLSRHLNHTGDEAATMGRKFDEAESHTHNLSGGLDKLKGLTVGIAGFLATAGAAAATAIGGAAAAVGAFAVKTAADNETARVSFDLLLGSSQKAGAFLKDLQAFAAATPFDMPTLRDASSRLLAVGVNAKDVIPLMTRLGDATAGMGTGADGINRAVYALQQMRQSGKVSLDDINQLTDAGIPALDALAAHMHLSIAALRDRITAGKVGAADLFASIENGEGQSFQRLKGMMDKQSVTLAGMWSTFKDNASQALATAVEPALPKLKQLLDWGAQAVPAAIQGIQEFVEKVKGFLKGSDVDEQLVVALKALAHDVIPVVKSEFKDLMKVISDHRAGLEGFAHFIADVVAPNLVALLGGALKTVIEVIKDTIRFVAWLGAAWDAHKNQVTTALTFLVEIVKDTFGKILHAAAIAFGWIPGIGPQLRDSAKEFDKFAAAAQYAIDKIHGKDVTVNVKLTGAAGSLIQTQGGGFNTTGGAKRAFAAGGPVPPGPFRVGENGPEELYMTGAGYVKPNNQLGGSDGASSQDIDVLAPVRFELNGHGVWQGMLAFKRQSGKTTLGLA